MGNKFIWGLLLIHFVLTGCGEGTKDSPNPKHDLYVSSEFKPTCDIDADALKDLLKRDVNEEIKCLRTNIIQYTKYVRRKDNRLYITQPELESFILKYFSSDDKDMADALELIFTFNTLLLKDEPNQLTIANITPLFDIMLVTNRASANLAKNLSEVLNDSNKYPMVRENIENSIEHFKNITLATIIKSRKTYNRPISIKEFLISLKEQMDVDINIETVSKFLFIKKLMIGGVDEKTISPDELSSLISKINDIAMIVFDLIFFKEEHFPTQKEYFQFAAKRAIQFKRTLHKWDGDTTIITTNNLLSLFNLILESKQDLNNLNTKFDLLKIKILGGKQNILTFNDILTSLDYIHETFTAFSLLKRTKIEKTEQSSDDDFDMDGFLKLITSKSDDIFATSLDLIGELKTLFIGGSSNNFSPSDIKIVVPVIAAFRDHGLTSTEIFKQIKKGDGNFFTHRKNLKHHLKSLINSYNQHLPELNASNHTEINIHQFLLKLKVFLKEFNFGIKMDWLKEELFPTIKSVKLLLCGGQRDTLTTKDFRYFINNFQELSLIGFDILFSKETLFESKQKQYQFMATGLSLLEKSLYKLEDSEPIFTIKELITLLQSAIGNKYNFLNAEFKIKLLKEKLIGGSPENLTYLDIKTTIHYGIELLTALSKQEDSLPVTPKNQFEITTIDDLIETFLSSDNDSIENAVNLALELKQILIMGTDKQFTPKDISKLIPLIRAFTDHGAKAAQILSDLRTDEQLDAWKKREDFRKQIRSIVTIFNEVSPFKTNYSLQESNFNKLILDIITFIKDFNVKIDEKYLSVELHPIIKATKLLFLGGAKNIITSGEVNLFINKLPDLSTSLLDLYFINSKHYSEDHITMEHNYRSVQTIISNITKRSDKVKIITITETIQAMQLLLPLKDKKYNVSELEVFFKNIKNIFIKNSNTEITQKDVISILDIISEGIGMSYYNSLTLKLTGKKYNINVMPLTSKYIPSIKYQIPRYWQRYVSALKTGKYYLTKDKGQYYKYNAIITYYGLNIKVITRWALEYIFKAYGTRSKSGPTETPAALQVSVKELQILFKLFKPILDLLGLNLSETIAQTSTYLGDLFQFKSNGNLKLDIFEARDYLELVYNSYTLGQKLVQELPEQCKIITNEEERYDAECFRDEFITIFFNDLKQSQTVTELYKYFETKKKADSLNYLKTIELFTKKVHDLTTPYTFFDITMFIGGLLNIESGFLRYDLNQDGILDIHEADKAYTVFKLLILEKAELTGFKKLFGKSLFFYLINKMKKPSQLQLMAYHFTPFKKVKANRLNIAKVIEFLMSVEEEEKPGILLYDEELPGP